MCISLVVQIIENHLLEGVLWAGHHVGQLCANDTIKIIYHYGTFVGMHFDHSFPSVHMQASFHMLTVPSAIAYSYHVLILVFSSVVLIVYCEP